MSVGKFTWIEGTEFTPHGFVDPEAIIGGPPEMDDWIPGDPIFYPQIHRAARITHLVTIDAGRQKHTTFGESYALAHSHVGHDAWIGDGCSISTGAIIGGHAIIGDGVHVGLGAVVLPYVRVGDGARIGAGAIVIDHVEPGVTVVGNPAKPLDPKRSRKTLKCCGGQPPDKHHEGCSFA